MIQTCMLALYFSLELFLYHKISCLLRSQNVQRVIFGTLFIWALLCNSTGPHLRRHGLMGHIFVCGCLIGVLKELDTLNLCELQTKQFLFNHVKAQFYICNSQHHSLLVFSCSILSLIICYLSNLFLYQTNCNF